MSELTFFLWRSGISGLTSMDRSKLTQNGFVCVVWFGLVGWWAGSVIDFSNADIADDQYNRYKVKENRPRFGTMIEG
jgi:hypothetical protein